MDNDGSAFRPEGLTAPQVPRNVPLSEAAKSLGLTEAQVNQLVKEEVLHEVSPGVFNSAEIARVAANKGLTVAQEAAMVGSGLQRALSTTFGVVKAVVATAMAGAVLFTVAVAGIAVAYNYYPTQVTNWLNQTGFLQTLLSPEARVALGILKFAQPTVYQQVTYNTVGTVSDIFTVKNGKIYPTEPLVIPQSSYLSIATTALVNNLNAQYLQGRIPGTTVGNIAIEGQVTNLADNSVDATAIQDGAVTNAKLSQITDANKVAGSAVQLSGTGGLTNNSGLSLLTSCSNGQILKWNSSNSTWECQADAGASGSGITAIQESGSTVVSSATEINFADNDFIVTETPATVGYIQIDYANSGITQKNVNQTISATWTFPSGTVIGTDTFTSNAITDSGPLAIKTTTNSALTLDSGTTGAVNLGTGANSKTVTVGNTTGTTSLNLESGSGGINLTGATLFNSTPITLGAANTVIDMTGTGTLSLNTTTNRAITTGTGLFTTGGGLTAQGALISNTSLTASGNLATPKGTDYSTTGTQNNVSLGNGSLFRYTGVASATFTGISGGTDGRLLRIANASSSTLTLNNQNAGSSAANQIVTSTGGDLVVGAGSAVNLAYDSGSSLWRVVSFTPTASTLGGTFFAQGGNGFGTTATLGTTDANSLNLITSGTTRFTFDSASATLTGNGATILTANSNNNLTINAGGTGNLTLGDSSSNQNIAIGTGAANKNITIGSSTGTTTINMISGTGGISIGDRAVNKTISIGGNIFNAADTINIATNSTSADTLAFGNNNSSTTFALTGGNKWSITSGGVLTLIGAQTPDITTTAGNSLTIDSGTTGALNFGTGANAKTITIGNGTGATSVVVNAGTGDIDIGSNDFTRNINIGTAATQVQTISIGGAAANAINVGNTQTGGSISLGAGMTTGTLSIGGTGLQTGTISLGTGTGAQSINLGTGGTGAKTLVLGSTASTGTTTIQSGTGNISLQPAGSGVTGTVQIGAGGAGSTTPDVLGLDIKTDGTDPTGGNGFMYYNSNLGKFRCYEAGAWKDCDTTGGTTTLQSAYNAGQTITLTTGKPLSITGGDATDTVGITPAGVLTLTSGGAAIWGTTAGNLSLQVAGTGTTANVQVGAGGGGSTTPDLLVVDQDTTTLPAGTNGAILLDSTGKFNIFEGGAWKILCNKTDAACGAGSGAALSAITAAIGGNSINSGDNAQVWDWALTTAAKTAFSFGENSASTNGAGAQYILGISTLNTSTAKPIKITAQGTANGIEVSTAGVLSAIGTGGINATQLNGATFAAPGTIGGGTPGAATFTTLTANTSITDAGLTANSGVYTDGSKVLTSTPPTSGILGYWNRTGTSLAPSNSGDAITTSGNISTSGTGTITSAGTLTASNGFTISTGALNWTTTSGSLSATGLTALTQTLSSGTAAITAPTLNLNTSSTGIVGIGNSTGAVTFNSPSLVLAGNSTVIDMSGTGTLSLNTTNNAPITTGTGLFTTGGAATIDTTLSVIGNFITPKGTDYSTTGTQDNVSFGAGSLFRYTGASSATFQGIANGTDGRFIRIMNASSSNIVLKNSSSGTAANNILTGTGGDLTISPNISVGLQYDSGVGVTAWRVVVLPANSATVGTFAFVQGGNAFGATANLGTTDANILSLITGGASRFQVAAGSSTLTGQGSSVITSTADLTVSSAAANNLNITSGTTGAVTVDSGSTGNVILGSGSSAKTITIGGSGANTINIGIAQTAGSIVLGTAMTTGTITIGGTGQTGTITLGSSSGTNIVAIGDGAGATTVNIANNETGGAVSIGAAMTTGTIQIGGTGAQTGTITIGGGTGAQTVNLATGGTGVKTVHIADGTAANIITIGTGQTGGSIALGSALTTGTIDIGNSSGAMTGTINIGGSTGAQSLNFGGGNTGVKTIAIGGGTAANVITIGNNQTGGSFAVGNAMTNGTITLGGASTTGTITIGQSTAGNTITIGSGNLTAATQTINIGNGTSTTSGGEAVNIGNGVPGTGTTNTIQIGTAGTTTGTVGVTIGSVGNAAHTTLIQGGSGNAITLTPQTTGIILIGASAGTGAITLGSSSAAQTVNIANGTGAGTINIANNQTGGSVNIGGAMTTGTITIGNTAGAQTGSITIDGGTGTQTINVATGAGAKTVTVGSQNTTSSLTLDSGTGTIAVGTGAQARTINIGTGAAVQTVTVGSQNSTSALTLDSGTGTIAIGTGAQARTINIGTGGAAQTVTLGSTSGAGSTTIASGTGGISIGTAAIAKTISIGNGAAAETINLGSTNTTSTTNINAGSGGVIVNGLAAQTNGNLTVCVNSGTHQLFIGNTASSCNTSSLQFKHNIQDLTLGLTAVNELRPVSFNYNSDNQPYLGFIAEEVAQIDERPIVRDANGVIRALDYQEIIPILTKGIQELDTKVNGIGINVNDLSNVQGVSLMTGAVTTLQGQVANLNSNFQLQISANNQTLTQSVLSQVTGMITSAFQNAAEFFGKVIFHQDVSFLAHVILGTDSAGHALVKAGDSEVDINFTMPYKNPPVISLNVYLTGSATIDQIPTYAIYDNTTGGFKVKLTRPAPYDIDFGWTAVEASGEVSGASTSGSAATPASSPAATSAPESSATPVPTPGAIETPAPTDTPTSTPAGTPLGSVTPTPTATAPPESPAASPTPP